MPLTTTEIELVDGPAHGTTVKITQITETIYMKGAFYEPNEDRTLWIHVQSAA